MRTRAGLPIVIVTVAITLAACSSDTAGEETATTDTRPPITTTSVDLPTVDPLVGLTTEKVASGLSEPVGITSHPGFGVFVAERTGSVALLSNDETKTVLDIEARVGWDINEQGFLGIALHPDFPTDPRLFTVYTNTDLDVIVTSFDWDGTGFDPDTESEILLVPQPHQYHQGGGIAFGPQGYLWVTFGDGGGVGDRYENGQNPFTLNGTVVRIDVDTDGSYAVPAANPFVEGGGDPAVWAYGLRNPWRISFDGSYIFIADVGQYQAEEINVASIDDGGLNFGWPIREGTDCYEAETCESEGLTPPTLDVPHEGTCAVIGGPVYRGTDIPEIHGHYVFGDFCTGWIRTSPVDDLARYTDWSTDIPRLGMLSTFGLDIAGELLMATLEGDVYRIVPVR